MADSLGVDRIAVVVIGRNEGERLLRCLRSIKQTQWPAEALELIYVDSASCDGSCEEARKEGARVLLAEQKGAAAARNTGWKAAQADWILFVDGDTVLAADFLPRALRSLKENQQIACVWGHRQELAPEQSVYVRVLDLDWRYPAGDTLFCGGDALFRRHALQEVGGFNPDLKAGEEPELCHRLRGKGWRILHIDAPMTLHDLAIVHFWQYWQRAVRAGYAYAAVSRHTGQLWQAEVWHALRQAGLLALVPALSLLASLAVGPLWALLPWLALLGLMIRSAWRARWRSHNTLTLMYYGIHSWFEQLPVAYGIWRCWQDTRLQRAHPVIDYKEGES